MILKEQLLDYSNIQPGDVYIFTANSMVKNSSLLMGGGAALAAYEAYPGVDKLLGAEINKHLLGGVYGYVQVPYNFIEVGAFQTKTVVWEPSKLDIIKIASEMLSNKATKTPDIKYHLNYPGIGLGGLDVEEVQPIIESLLPDNIIVYK
jgi:hypothetical protein